MPACGIWQPPDSAALELGQQCYTTIFTHEQVSAAVSGLPLQLVSDHSVYEYEKAYLPAGAWPPTSWYADWVSGRDVFDLPREDSPIEMHWLVYQKPALVMTEVGPSRKGGRLLGATLWPSMSI
jgi:hypothetical protein